LIDRLLKVAYFVSRMVKLLIIILFLHAALAASGQLTANFSTDKSSGCGPLVINFTNQTSGASGAALYHWDLGNGNIATETNPRAVYTQPGSYTVVLTVQDGGQSSTANQTVTVYSPPAAAFTVSATKVCAPAPIQFTSTSTPGGGGAGGGSGSPGGGGGGAIVTWLWDFGDGNTESGGASSVGHAYTVAGTEGVSLTVTDVNGCVATQVQPGLLTILPQLTASFTTSQQVLCAVGDPVQFTNTSTGPGTLSYHWSFGDGNTSGQASPQYVYAAKGTYTVILTATSPVGCVAADTQTNLLNVANFQDAFTLPANVCVGASTVFTDNSTPAPTRQRWVIDGNSPEDPAPPVTYTFTSAGAHSVMLLDVFGTCQQSVTKNFTVNASPVIPPFDAVLSSTCGAPVTVNFLDHTPGAVKWGWLFNYVSYNQFQDTVFGGPANSNVYGENGTTDVELTVTNAAGCMASVVQQVRITPPFVEIVLTSGTPETCGQPMTETFGSAQLGNLASWTWVFGDGTTSTAAAPTHTFTNPGNYQTTLNWTDKNGCTGNSNTLFTVITAPLNLDFTADATTVCVGQQVSFGGPLVVNNGVLYQTWSFGDGAQAFTQDGAVHTYTTPGVYTVTLFAENAGECQQTIVKNNYITVLPSPTLNIFQSYDCAGTRGDVTFTVTAGGGATSLVWDFGDGTTQTTDATITQLVHTYTTSRSYSVNVTASNGTSCSYTSALLVTVALRPTALQLTGSAGAICPDGTLVVGLSGTPAGALFYHTAEDVAFQYGDSTTFQGSAVITQGDNYTSYAWNLSGFESGEGSLRAISRDYNGCYDTSNFIPLLIGGVRAGYEIVQDDQCYQLPVLLEDTSAVGAGNRITSWLWDFGDGQTSAQSGTVSHLYAAPGSYTVKLTVQDASGCASSSLPAVAQVTVNGPEAAFSPSGGSGFPAGTTVFPAGATIQFNNTSNVYGSGNVQWSWNFGDGNISAAFDPAHVYSLPGTYTVTLLAQGAAGGCTTTATVQLVIQPFNTAFSKTASYIASGTCPPVLVQFTNTSSNYSSFSWNFGDGEVEANVSNPSHVYSNAGTYIVTLTINGTNGQTVQTVDSVVVIQPSALLSASAAAICMGQSATLLSTVNQGVKGYTWDFGDGSVSSGGDSVMAHVYSTAGNFTAKLVVTDSLGCSVAAAAGVAIDVHAPPVVGVTPPVATVCLGKGTGITAIGGGSYSWSPAAGLSDAGIAAPVAAPVVNTVYTVTVTDDIGCKNGDSIVVSVVRPDTVVVDPDSVALCPGKTVTLHASGASGYRWIGAVDGLSATDVAAPVVSPVASMVYEVAGSDQYGCFADTVAVIVNLLIAPTVNAGPDQVVLAETPVTIDAVGSPDIVSWLWTPAIYLSCTDCAQPVCIPKEPEQYIVTVTAADGCMAGDTVVVQLLCDEAKVSIPDAFTPNGDGHNDRWRILGGISEVDHLVIFDRWGAKVFEENHFYPADPNSGWDGTMGGRPLPAGIYVYFVEMHCPTGGVFSRKGTVVLVR
jgi:gliding motility-associated-like protein